MDFWIFYIIFVACVVIINICIFENLKHSMAFTSAFTDWLIEYEDDDFDFANVDRFFEQLATIKHFQDFTNYIEEHNPQLFNEYTPQAAYKKYQKLVKNLAKMWRKEEQREKK